MHTPTILPADSPFQVLFGRGRARDHIGNKRVQQIVQRFHDEYEHADKQGKTEISNQIIDMVHQSGGRFLKQETTSKPWFEVDRVLAREKIAMFFRKLRRESS